MIPSTSTAPVLRAAHVRRSVDDAFALFTDRIGAWWPLPTHGMFGDRAGGVAFVGGRLVERSVTGEECVWGEVLVWEPPTRLVMTWHPGRPAEGPAGRVEVCFVGDEHGTRIELRHDGWEAFGEQLEEVRGRYAGPNAWGFVLDHLGDLADRHAGAGAEGLDALAAAHEAFLAEAVAGGFGAPAEGEWTAEQVVAHVAVNDDVLSAICRELIHAHTPVLDNAVSNDVTVLDALVRDRSMVELVADARARAEQLRLLLARLDDGQRATMVACRLQDHGEVVLDQAMPWSVLAITIHATRHLPGHTEQLRALRG